MAATLTQVNSILSTEADFLPPPPSFTVIHRGESTASKQAKTTNSNRTERQADSNSDSCNSSSTRKKRSSGDGQHSNLIVAFYSVCCLYQFIRYLPLLILRVCFGSMQQQSASPNARRATKSKASSSNSNPSMKTLAGLLLLGLPLMLLSGLPIIGRLVSSSPASPSSRASSRSRASSISSAASSSRAGCRSYSMSSASDS